MEQENGQWKMVQPLFIFCTNVHLVDHLRSPYFISLCLLTGVECGNDTFFNKIIVTMVLLFIGTYFVVIYRK